MNGCQAETVGPIVFDPVHNLKLRLLIQVKPRYVGFVALNLAFAPLVRLLERNGPLLWN